MGDTGSASGALQAFQRVGGALGIAVVGEVFFARLGGHDAAPTAYDHAFSSAILYNVVVFSIIAGLIWLLPRPKGQEVGAEHERDAGDGHPAAAE